MRYHEDMKDPNCGVSMQVLTTMTKSFDKEVDNILAVRIVQRQGIPPYMKYLVEWKNMSDSEAS